MDIKDINSVVASILNGENSLSGGASRSKSRSKSRSRAAEERMEARAEAAEERMEARAEAAEERREERMEARQEMGNKQYCPWAPFIPMSGQPEPPCVTVRGGPALKIRGGKTGSSGAHKSEDPRYMWNGRKYVLKSRRAAGLKLLKRNPELKMILAQGREKRSRSLRKSRR
jgi:hypothetical protein